MTRETLEKLLPLNTYTNALNAHLEENGGEIDEVAEQLMQKIEQSEDALVSLANYRQRLAAQGEGIRAELEPIIKELQADIRAYDSAIEWVENRIRSILPHDQQVCNGSVNIYYTESSAVEIIDADALPIELVHVETVPDKKAIKAKLQAGEEVPGAVLKLNHNLQIKHAGPRAEKAAKQRAKAKAKKNVDFDGALSDDAIRAIGETAKDQPGT